MTEDANQHISIEQNIITQVIMHVTGASRLEVVLGDYCMNEQQLQLYGDIVDRLQNHEPFSKIIQESWFYGRRFYINEDVLDPRPETETIVDLAKELLTDYRSSDIEILELGVGSGCLLVSLIKELGCNGIGVDISDKALAIAARNLVAHDIGVKVNYDLEGKRAFCKAKDLVYINENDNCTAEQGRSEDLAVRVDVGANRQMQNICSATLILGSWFDRVPVKKFGLIVSNPPYVDRKDDIGAELKFDPDLALFAGDDGYEYYDTILKNIRPYLGGYAILELPAKLMDRLELQSCNLGFHVSFKKIAVENIVFAIVSA